MVMDDQMAPKSKAELHNVMSLAKARIRVCGSHERLDGGPLSRGPGLDSE